VSGIIGPRTQLCPATPALHRSRPHSFAWHSTELVGCLQTLDSSSLMGQAISHYSDLEKLGGGEAVAHLRAPWPDSAAATPSEMSMPPGIKRWRRDQLGLPRTRSRDALHHDLPCTIPHRNRNTFLMHIHADILFCCPWRALLSVVSLSRTLQTLRQKGRPFILRRVTVYMKWRFTFANTLE
jgi:hypothetical protein